MSDTLMHVCVYIYMHVCVYTYICMYVCMVCKYTHSCIHICIHIPAEKY